MHISHFLRLPTLVLFAALVLPPTPARADCASPRGSEGEIAYNGDYGLMQFCDGTSWISMAASTAANEIDPKVGLLTSSNFCRANAGGTAVDCTTAAINLGTDVTGTLPTTSLSGTITNAQLAGSIDLSKFAASGTPGASVFLRGDGQWIAPTFTEADPKVGALTNGKWCSTDGSVITCTQNAPTLSEVDPKVGALTADNWCRANSAGTSVVCSTASINLASDVTGSLPTTSLSGTITNAQLAGSIALSKLDAAGTPSTTTYLRGDGTWAEVSAGDSGTVSSGNAKNLAYYSTSGTTIQGTSYITTDPAAGTGNMLIVNTSGPGVRGLIVKAAPMQVVSLQEWQHNTGSLLASIDSTGRFQGPAAWLTNTTAANKVFIVKGAASQSGNLTEWQNSSSSVLASVSAAGTITAPSFSGSGVALTSLNASNLASGTVPTARLGTGTPSSSTYLRGDGTWAAPAGGGANCGSTPHGQITGIAADTGGGWGCIVYVTIYQCFNGTIQSYSASGGNGCPSSCFAAGTPVLVADGTHKAIDQLENGDKVIGRGGKINTVIALKATVLGGRRLYTINGSLKVTGDHPALTDKGWAAIEPELYASRYYGRTIDVTTKHGKSAWTNDAIKPADMRTLKLGDNIAVGNTGYETITTITSEALPPDTQLYTVAVDGDGTLQMEGGFVFIGLAGHQSHEDPIHPETTGKEDAI